MLLPGALLSGLIIYFIFSYLFMPTQITLPASIIIFVLVFVLSKYYASGRNWSSSNRTAIVTDSNNNDDYSTDSTRRKSAIGPTALHELSTDNQKQDGSKKSGDKKQDVSNNERYSNNNDDAKNNNKSKYCYKPRLTNILFVIGYIIALLIVVPGSFTTISKPNSEASVFNELFIPWQQFNTIDIIKLGAAVGLSFFLPGYALVNSIILTEEKKNEQENKRRIDSINNGGIISNINGSIGRHMIPEQSEQRLLPKSLLKVLLGYILSIFITGLTAYIAAFFGIRVSGINIILPLFVIYTIILVVFILRTSTIPVSSLLLRKRSFNFTFNSATPQSALLAQQRKTRNNNKSISPEIILVFVCLFALVVLSTYYLYGGIIIGDQWFHHGRALLFISGTFKDFANSAQDDLYPPFLSAFLAAFISLSDNPSVNAYASISFLNIMPVIASYYFFTKWIPDKWRKASLLACTLFVLSGGFGWIYAVSTAISSSAALHHPAITSYESSLAILTSAVIKTFDIVAPSTFLLVSHPDFSTGMQLIVLPVGFVLLGLLKEERRTKETRNERETDRWYYDEKGDVKEQKQRLQQTDNKNKNKNDNSNVKYFVIVTLISLLGILSHDEIYLFIIIVSITPIIFGLPKKHFVYAAFLAAIAITFLIDHMYSENYFTSTLIVGIPLLYLSFLFVGFTWAVYAGKTSISKLFSSTKKRLRIHKVVAISKLKGIVNNDNSSSSFSSPSATRIRIRIASATIIALIVVYWYIFTFIVWAEIPLKEVRLQTSGSDLNVPWYLFPMKLGVTGLIGLAFVLSYLFKKFQKEVFVFGIIAIIALFAGPYYDEQRTNKYVMLGMVGFASIFVYKIISMITGSRSDEISSSLSSTLTIGSNETIVTKNKNNKHRESNIPEIRTLACGLIIGSLVVVSSLSVLLYIGYHASALQTQNFRLAEPGSDFPSPSELNMFRFINSHLTDSKTYNIALMTKGYTLQPGLNVNKIQGFMSIPQSVLVTAPLTLNSSTLEGFYNLLNKSNTRYIIVPAQIASKNDVVVGGGGEQSPTNVLRFALNNFQRVYEDKNYVLLAVPSSLTPPLSTGGNVALVYQKSGSLSLVNSNNNNSYSDKNINDSKVLLYNNQSFNKIDSSSFVKIDNEKKTAVLYGNKIKTLWSRPVIPKGEKVSYIEATFRVLQENKTKTNRDCGVVWDDGIKQYYTRIAKDKLQFSQTDSKGPFTFQDQGIKAEKNMWYKLKILFVPTSTVDIYVNDLLKLRVPKNPVLPETNNNTSHNFKTGIRCSGNIGQFEPLQIGLIPSQVSGRQQQSHRIMDYDKTIYNYFYSLNTLALSKIGYSAFLQDDYSAFSKRNIILTFDSASKADLDRYLEYVKRGGNLIVINSDNNYNTNGSFSKLLEIQGGKNVSKFTGVVGSPAIQQLQSERYRQDQHYFKVSGITRDIQFKESPDVKVLSFYLNNNNQSVARFAIEKDYDGGGKIVFVNAGGYFEAISKNPYQYFGTLSNFPSLIALKSSKYTKEAYHPPPTGSITTARYIGNATILGQTLINSSSFLLSDGSTVGSYNLSAKGISISSDHKTISYDNRSKNTVLTNNNNTEQPEAQLQSKAVNADTSGYIRIKDLKVIGQYQVIINSTGRVYLPSSLSYSDYISISFPAEFSLTLRLSRGAIAEFTTDGLENNTRHIRIINNHSDDYIIQFYRIRADSPQVKTIPVLMKSPQIEATGNISFGRLYLDMADYHSHGIRGWPVQINGNLSAKVDHVDHYDFSTKRSYTKDYLTYLQWFKADENKKIKTSSSSSTTTIEDQLRNLRIPGDVSYIAKQASSSIPWQQAAGSTTNFWVIIALIIITTIGMRLLWPKIMKAI